MKWIAIAALLVATALALLWAWGQARWSTLTRELHAQLEAARTAPQPARYDAARELPGLPDPVQRFFRAALTDGMPLVAAVRIEHRGTFNLSEDGESWRPFTSTQRSVMRRPGFVWDGRVSMAPGLAVHVHDAYAGGVGELHPALAGLVSMTRLRGTPELAEGELMRWFAESAWYPTALLPSQGVRWEAVDERSARATLADGSVQTTLLFRFGEDGLVSRVRAEARGRTVKGVAVPTPWEGEWRDYALRDGMRVPLAGEVAWITPQGRRPYWRGTVSALSYEFAAR